MKNKKAVNNKFLKEGKQSKNKTFKTTKMPLKSSSINLAGESIEEVRVLKDIYQTPKKSSVSLKNALTSPEKRRRKNPLENLQSTLSPKYIGFNKLGENQCRRGRQQRYKASEEILSSNITCYVRRTSSKLKAITPPGRGEQKFVSYESPIEKLIKKNKILAKIRPGSLPSSSQNAVIKSKHNISLINNKTTSNEIRVSKNLTLNPRNPITRGIVFGEKKNNKRVSKSVSYLSLRTAKVSIQKLSRKELNKQAWMDPVSEDKQEFVELKASSLKDIFSSAISTDEIKNLNTNTKITSGGMSESNRSSKSKEEESSETLSLDLSPNKQFNEIKQSVVGSFSDDKINYENKVELKLNASVSEGEYFKVGKVTKRKDLDILSCDSLLENRSQVPNNECKINNLSIGTEKCESTRLLSTEHNLNDQYQVSQGRKRKVVHSEQSIRKKARSEFGNSTKQKKAKEISQKLPVDTNNSLKEYGSENSISEENSTRNEQQNLSLKLSPTSNKNISLEGISTSKKKIGNKNNTPKKNAQNYLPKLKGKTSSPKSTSISEKQPNVIRNMKNNLKLEELTMLNNMNHLLTNDSIHFRQLNKSPSTNSTDSAKGSSIDTDMDFPTSAGEIFWGKIPPYPYWPCIVWPDPQGRTISIQGNTRFQKIKIHVRFFADNGRRSWIKKSDMFPYNGQQDFERRKEEVTSKYPKNHTLLKAFVINEKKKLLWEQAISEAEIVYSVKIDKRQSKFEDILKEYRDQVSIERQKRRLSSNDINCSQFYSGLSEAASSTTSEFGECFASLDDFKGERSSAAESPAFQDIDELSIFVKKEMEGADIANLKSNVPVENDDICSLYSSLGEPLFEDDDFKNFYDIMRAYVLNYSNEYIEKHLYQTVKRIWVLKNIARNALRESSTLSLTSSGELNTRRLALKMKNLSKLEDLKERKALGFKTNTTPAYKKDKKSRSKPIEEVVKDIMDLNKNYLFKGLRREPVCKECYKPSNLFKCSGSCQSWVHKSCIDFTRKESVQNQDIVHMKEGSMKYVKESAANESKSVSVLCKECSSGEEPKCFVCNRNDSTFGEKFRCHINWCGKYYHLNCLKYWPQSKMRISSAKVETLLCPGHVCHTCVSDDPRGKFLQIEKSKLAKCVQCPATYHLDSSCIPAGTQFLTAVNLICPRHREQKPNSKQNINANWCFICTSGGSLICCETCPSAFHLECLKIPQPEGGYICEECETGRLPLYGELVWAKLGTYRWWPAIIIPPPEVPKNLELVKHDASDFCVRFFGSNDHTWINRNRVFLYQEGDWGHVNQARSIDQNYKNGLEEARKISELIKTKKLSQMNDKDKRLTPLPYVKIKSNRPVPPVKLQEIDISDLTPCDCNPKDRNPCAPNSSCVNRLLMTECNPKVCPAGSKCQNQMFEKRMYPPLKVCRTNGKGWGLMCEQDLVSGTFIIEYVGEVIDEAEFQRRIAQKQEEKDENYYFLILEKDYIIDAGPKGNLARFMNHSCEPNCETQKWTVNGITRVGLFAMRDIAANTELTFNYNLECIGDDKKVCHCGAKKCSGYIGVKYKNKDSDRDSEKISNQTPTLSKKVRAKAKKRKEIKEI